MAAAGTVGSAGMQQSDVGPKTDPDADRSLLPQTVPMKQEVKQEMEVRHAKHP